MAYNIASCVVPIDQQVQSRAEEVSVVLPSSRSRARPGSAPVDRTKSDRTASMSRVMWSWGWAAQAAAVTLIDASLPASHAHLTTWKHRQNQSDQFPRIPEDRTLNSAQYQNSGFIDNNHWSQQHNVVSSHITVYHEIQLI